MINNLIFQPPQTATYSEKTHAGSICWIPKPAATLETYEDLYRKQKHSSSIRGSFSRVSASIMAKLAAFPVFSGIPEINKWKKTIIDKMQSGTKEAIAEAGFGTGSGTGTSFQNQANKTNMHRGFGREAESRGNMGAKKKKHEKDEKDEKDEKEEKKEDNCEEGGNEEELKNPNIPYSSKSMACLFAPHVNSGCLVMFMHGRGGDVGDSYDFICRMRNMCHVNVIAVEYPGYGVYVDKEKPSEQTMFERVVCAFDVLSDLPTVGSIVIIGYSLGCTAACEIGAKRSMHPKLRGVVLIAPFASVHHLINDFATESYTASALKRLMPDAHFCNKDAICKITRPVLIVHGSVDEIIPVGHSHTLSAACPGSKLIVIAGMTHDIHTHHEPKVLEYIKTHLRKVAYDDLWSQKDQFPSAHDNKKTIKSNKKQNQGRWRNLHKNTENKKNTILPEIWFQKPEDDDREFEKKIFIDALRSKYRSLKMKMQLKNPVEKELGKKSGEIKEADIDTKAEEVTGDDTNLTKTFGRGYQTKRLRTRMVGHLDIENGSLWRWITDTDLWRFKNINLDTSINLLGFGVILLLLYFSIKRYYNIYLTLKKKESIKIRLFNPAL